MENIENTLKYAGTVFIVTEVVGLTSFYLAGGIPGLANDIGVLGAWVVLFVFQLIYSMLFTVGFLAAKYFIHGKIDYKPTKVIIIGTALMATFVNLYGIFEINKLVDFLLFVTVLILSSMVVYLGLLWLNSLTNQWSQ